MDIQSLLLVTKQVKCVAKITYSVKELTDEFRQKWITWASNQTAACVVEEFGRNGGHPHLEMIIATSCDRSNIQRQIRTKIGEFTNIECVTKYPKDAKNVAWCAKYGRKENGHIVLHEHGWDWKRIEIIGADDLKRVRDYKVNKNMRVLSTNNCQAIIMEYAKTKGLSIGCKESFKDVLEKMAKEGYQFQNVRGISCIWGQVELMLNLNAKHFTNWLDRQLDNM